MTNSSEQAETQQLTFVEAANRAGVKQIVKQSQWAADADSPVQFLRYDAVRMWDCLHFSASKFIYARFTCFSRNDC